MMGVTAVSTFLDLHALLFPRYATKSYKKQRVSLKNELPVDCAS